MTRSLPDLRSFRFSDISSNILFMDSAVLDGDAVDLTDMFTAGIKGRFLETDKFFQFGINPTTLAVRKAKIISQTFTKQGFSYSHHGNDMTKLTYRGTTGWFHPPSFPEITLEIAKVVPGFPATVQNVHKMRDEIARLMLSGQIDITQSPRWQKFRRFEVFIDRIQGELVLYFDQRLYRGQMISFNYNENANDPLQILYEFEFHAFTDTRTGPDRSGKALLHLGIR
jgi:hypothetical protein